MGEYNSIAHKDILLFDGVCNLCNNSINFVIDHDPDEKFKFAALQSEFGQKKLRELNLNPKDFDSIVLLSDNQTHVKSTAALKVAKKLSGGWPMLYAFIIVPTFIRDAVYNIIAKSRYKVWGKTDQCRVPTPELKQRFIEG